MSTFDQASLFDLTEAAPAPTDAHAPTDAPAPTEAPAAGGSPAISSGPVLVIVGPTASGKSSVAMEIARRRGDVEVVAIDAFTVYKGMDLGTAKPTAEDRAEVPHHMVDVLAPTETVTVAWFRDRAREAIADVHARGRVPLLVGGSGLYFRAVVDPLDFPPTDPVVRAGVEERWAHDPALAHAHLAEVDPEAASRIEPDNLRRVVRALEVRELTGRPFSSFRTDWDGHASVYDPGLHVARLDPDPDLLRKAVDERAAQMVEAGLVDECARLREQYGELSETARQGIGYAEAFDVLDGKDPEGLAQAISKRTRNYARRQRAWFRRDPRCEVVAPEVLVERFVQL